MSAGNRPVLLSRRGFVQAASGVIAAQTLSPMLHALSRLHATPGRLACRAAEDGIEMLRVQGSEWERQGSEWERVAFTPCEAPTALALHGASQILYVAHGTENFHRLPCGSVGCYRIHPQTETLFPLHRERLSLACIQPDALAVSPDRALLVVASSQTGILNMLPLDSEGRPGSVAAARKELQEFAAEAAQPAPVEIRFVSERVFLVSDPQRQARSMYRCNEDEIVLLQREVTRDRRETDTAVAGSRIMVFQ